MFKFVKSSGWKNVVVGVLAVAGLVSAMPSQAANVAVVDPDGRWSAATPFFQSARFGDTVTTFTSYNQIANMSSYNIIWDAAYFYNDASQSQRVIDFVNGGGGFYGQVERPCCESHNAWLQGIFRTLTGNNSLVFGGAGDSPNQGDSNFLTPDLSILMQPKDIRNTTFDSQAPGQLSGVEENRIFAKQTNGFNVGAAWATTDLVNKAGRLVVVSDVDWLNSLTDSEKDALDNFRLFLLAGNPLPQGCGANPNLPECQQGNVPEPGSLALLGLALFGLVGVRRARH